MPKKRYVVKLTAEERVEFKALLKKGKAAAWKRQRVQALLLCDQGEEGPGWIDARVAEAVDCTSRSLENWRKQAVEDGPDSLLERKPHPPKPPKLDGEGEARLVALACSKPPQGRASWTLQLLADALVEMQVVDSICDETVRQALKKKRAETLAQDDVVHSARAGRRLRVPDGAGAGSLQAPL
jgi:transposase-like protein